MEKYIEASQQAGKHFYNTFHNADSLIMLNLLRFKTWADYTAYTSEIPNERITGRAAYQKYLDNTSAEFDHLGSQILFMGTCGSFLIGPETETWDLALLVKHQSVKKFMEFANSESYLKNVIHRNAALEDSRLLPMSQVNNNDIKEYLR